MSMLRPSFRSVLQGLFAANVVVAVAVVGWLAYRSGQQSVADIADLLRGDYSMRIEESLSQRLQLPQRLVELNLAPGRARQLQVSDPEPLQARFRSQLDAFADVSYLAWAEPDGSMLTVYRTADGYEMQVADPSDRRLRTYALDDLGRRGALVDPGKPYDARTRPWVTIAVASAGLAWADVYVWFDKAALCLDAVQAIRDDEGELIGVIDAGFTLADISAYLASLEIGTTGQTFVVDGDGQLIASSVEPALRAGEDGTLERVKASHSDDPIVRAVAEYIDAHHDTFAGLSEPLDIEIDHDGAVFLQITPLPGAVDGHWVLVVAVPEADFIGPVVQNSRTTLVWSVVAVALSLLIGMGVVRWIVAPIRELTVKARRIRQGDLDVEFVPRSDDEIGALTTTMGEMVAGLRDRERIRDAFGRYVAPDVAEHLLNQPGALEPGGKLQNLTILMSDLRGFTDLSHRLGPQQTIAMLNEYLSRMSEVIEAHDGLINEFIGDAILVLFGAPDPGEDDEVRAVRCAVAMLRALRELNEATDVLRDDPLQMGIGVHTGEVILGNIGSERRVKYGVVGDTVNLTSRIESLTSGGEVLVSQATRERVGDRAVFGSARVAHLKGYVAPLTVHPVREVGGLAVPDHLDDERVAAVGSVHLSRVVGKEVDPTPIPAELVSLGRRSAVVRATGIDPEDTVKLVFGDGEVRFARLAGLEADVEGLQRCVVRWTRSLPSMEDG